MLSTQKLIRFGVIGCGHIGKRHAEMITRQPGAELAALADTKPVEELGIEQYDVPFFSSLEEMLRADPDLDVISVATPNGLHATHALACLDARKHVVIEKPLALSRQDAERVLHKALARRRDVFAVMQNRYSPPSQWLKEVVDSGILGKLYIVQMNCYWNRDERYYTAGSWHGLRDLDGGTLFTQFSHFIDIMYWLFGDITGIQARLMDFNHQHLTDFEDSGFVSFQFLNGGMGTLNFSTSVWQKNLESSITIIAENGSIKVGGQYMDRVEYCHIRDYVMPTLAPTNPGNDYGSYTGSAQNHNFVFENVVKVLQNQATITTNAMEGLKVVDIIERIYQSANREFIKTPVRIIPEPQPITYPQKAAGWQ
ncbi:Gfo/Idh/MocA family oxidoreductase [Nibrella saemangeumensis]|uniref:Gfo/Idh/MocA family oxidoreductase n=1 Tax=Nibrella saemangeumensis TaxID=1084526 RepID=A0ABP8N018_9BACT